MKLNNPDDPECTAGTHDCRKKKAAKRRRHRILKANKSHVIQETISTTTSLPKPSFIKHQTIRHKASSP